MKRRWVSFGPLLPLDRLAPVKLWTNALEAEFLNERGGRRINIDPGYLVSSKFVLATGKDYSHRIYLADGIFADLTLVVRKGAFTTLPWTYPDYGSAPLIGLLASIRQRYMWQMKNGGPEAVLSV
jgi:hypothetical protein